MTHLATVRWRRGEQPFSDGRYSRIHEVVFDGITIPGSSSPSVVRPPLSVEAAVDPEEAFTASISSCHMLWFLDIARHAGFVVDSYEDAAEGVLAKDAQGRVAMTKVTLHPAVRFSGEQPTPERYAALHHEAHELCFIANSVKTEVAIQPTLIP
jgi:organic hydroperoxide reductase OsmC/OhrA